MVIVTGCDAIKVLNSKSRNGRCFHQTRIVSIGFTHLILGESPPAVGSGDSVKINVVMGDFYRLDRPVSIWLI